MEIKDVMVSYYHRTEMTWTDHGHDSSGHIMAMLRGYHGDTAELLVIGAYRDTLGIPWITANNLLQTWAFLCEHYREIPGTGTTKIKSQYISTGNFVKFRHVQLLNPVDLEPYMFPGLIMNPMEGLSPLTFSTVSTKKVILKVSDWIG